MDDADALAIVERACAAGSGAAAPLDPALEALRRDGVSGVTVRQIQRLWGGMGAVYSLVAQTAGGGSAELVAKRVALPSGALSFGDQRKKDSYACEACFYESLAPELRRAGCGVPAGLLVERRDDGSVTIVMSKLAGRSRSLGAAETATAVGWVARMHACTWGARADAAVAKGLQAQGCYWYLDTRPDEWESMPERGWQGRLKHAAKALDRRLKHDPSQCCVHGDLKADNLCFAGQAVAMCDFQYCGKACPTKDLAYLLCCAADEGCSRQSSEKSATHHLAPVDLVAERLVGCRYLAMYHTLLSEGLSSRGEPAPALESLRAALDLAYADLCRWMVGWGLWGDTTELEVSASCQRFLSVLSATASCQRVFFLATASQRHVLAAGAC